jgi:hypothetical protein
MPIPTSHMLRVSLVCGVALAIGCGKPDHRDSERIIRTAPQVSNLWAAMNFLKPGQEFPARHTHGPLAAMRTANVSEVWYKPKRVPGRPDKVMLTDGEIVSLPPGDTGPLPAIRSHGQWSCRTGDFKGFVPPACTDSGPFRRAFSAAHVSGAMATISLPTVNGLPIYPPAHGDTGFIYLEMWPISNINAGNYEAGFMYSANHNWYTPYLRTTLMKKGLYGSHNFLASEYPVLGIKAFHISREGCTSCFVMQYFAISNSYFMQTATVEVAANGMASANCCIVARMTTIGQNLGAYAFSDGSSFGPFVWQSNTCVDSGSKWGPECSTWKTGGSQLWPDDQTRVGVTADSNEESVIISLHD